MAKSKQSPMDAMIGALGVHAKKRRRPLDVETLASAATNLKWIDFCDPKTGLPSLALEWLWGMRGMPLGRILKIEAEEGVGKSSYLMLMYGAAQRACEAWCLHMEGELAKAPPDFIASFGCNPDKIFCPTLTGDNLSIEGCFRAIDGITLGMRQDAPGADPLKKHPVLIGVDSISSFGDAKNMEEEEGSDSSGLGSHSRFLSGWFRDRWGRIAERDAFMMLIAQVRSNIQIQGFGKKPKQSDTTTLAARPINFHSSFRLEMRTSPLKIKEPPYSQYGDVVTLTTTKNKLSPKGKSLQVPLIWDKGFDLCAATVDLLQALSPIVLPGGATFTLTKQPGGRISAPLLQEGTFSFGPDRDAEVLYRLYENVDLLMALREALRIRGFGFKFEDYYIPDAEELSAAADSPDEV